MSAQPDVALPTVGEALRNASDAFYTVVRAVSQGHRDVAADVRPQIEERLTESRELVHQLRQLLREAEGEQVRLEELLARVDGVLDPERARASIGLAGKRLGLVAVQVLEQSDRAQPIHYRDWFELVRDQGQHVAGRDPLANFLTALSRHPRVERVGARTGLYRLAEEASE